MFCPIDSNCPTNSAPSFPNRCMHEASKVAKMLAGIILKTFNCYIGLCESLAGRVANLFSRQEKKKVIDLTLLSDSKKNTEERPELEHFKTQFNTICNLSTQQIEQLKETGRKVHGAVLVILFERQNQEPDTRAISSPDGIRPSFDIFSDLNNVVDYEFYSYQFYDHSDGDITVYDKQNFDCNGNSQGCSSNIGYEAFNKEFEIEAKAGKVSSAIQLEDLINTTDFRS